MSSVDETDARSAFRLREGETSYREIAEMLGVSSGQAHHLTRRGREHAEDDAHDALRPPSSDREPSQQRAKELLSRLELDIERVRLVIQNHRDVSADDIASAVSECQGSVREIDTAIGALPDQLAGSSGSDRASPEDDDTLPSQFGELRESFGVLVDLACRCDGTFAVASNRTHVLRVFEHDAAAVARILHPNTSWPDSALSFDLQPTDLQPTDPGGHEAGPGPRRAGDVDPNLPMSRDERRDRDYRIIQARLRRAPVKKIAETFGITDRQVSRILRRWRESSHPGDEAGTRAVLAGIAELGRDLDAIDQASAKDPESAMALAENKFLLLRERVELMSDAGMLSPEVFAAAEGAHLDWVTEVNQRLRRMLEGRNADPELVQAVVEEVVEASGFGHL